MTDPLTPEEIASMRDASRAYIAQQVAKHGDQRRETIAELHAELARFTGRDTRPLRDQLAHALDLDPDDPTMTTEDMTSLAAMMLFASTGRAAEVTEEWAVHFPSGLSVTAESEAHARRIQLQLGNGAGTVMARTIRTTSTPWRNA